jgi:N-acetylglucosamine repressor
MKTVTTLRPSLVGKLNERLILRVIQSRGPSSRADVTRYSGLSAPTVSKAVANLLQSGFLEETDAVEAARGRPAPKLRLATETAQVLGVVLDVDTCEVVSAGLDGLMHNHPPITLVTPKTYDELLELLTRTCKGFMKDKKITTLGVGISIPGLIDYHRMRGVLSPNLHMTDGRTPGLDLTQRLGVPCVIVQESHALVLAERYYGAAMGMDDFAMLDLGTGIGLGVLSGGRLLKGRSGLAGELGHTTVIPKGGRSCGCGNTGCLETEASDTAFARRVMEKIGRKLTVDDAITLAKKDPEKFKSELHETMEFLSIGVATVIHLLNPSAVFLHGRIFECDPMLFMELLDRVKSRTLQPAFEDCKVELAKGCKKQGAIAGVIQHLTSEVANGIEML